MRYTICDLSGFCNLEYLSIGYIKLCGRPFQNLHKLIKLQIKDCDLSEFDLDSLNSVTTLQIIEIKNQLDHIALFDQPIKDRFEKINQFQMAIYKYI